MLSENPADYSIWGYLLSLSFWIILAITLGSWLLRRAKKDGQGRLA